MRKNNILIIGSGAREHAIGWKLKQSKKVDKIYFAPGTVGTKTIGESTGIEMLDTLKLIQFALDKQIDLTVVSQDDAQAAGIVNAFQEKNLRIFGTTKEASLIESSKAFAKKLMKDANIPTAKYQTFTNIKKAQKYIINHPLPLVIKASGLALGKGVVIAKTLQEANKTLEEIMIKKVFGDAGDEVVIEEFLTGPEVSIHAFSDGKNVALFPPARDHKTIYENNQGPNTGGMGTIAPVADLSSVELEKIKHTIVLPIIKTLRKRGTPFVGCLFPGLIMTSSGPKVLEFNSRFGDPETESYMRLLESDLFDIFNSCIEGKLAQQKIIWSKKTACCIVLASAGYPTTSHKGDIIFGLDKIRKQKDIVIFHFGTKEEKKNVVTNGGRVLGISATGKTLEEALKKSYAVIGKKGIYFDGMQYRKDIGKPIESQTKPFQTSRIEVFSKVPDTRADIRKKTLRQINKKITSVTIVDVYTIDKPFFQNDLAKISSALSNTTTQETLIQNNSSGNRNLSEINSSQTRIAKFSFAIEIGYLPGVTDNIATTAKETISDLLQTSFDNDETVYTSQITFLTGNISKKEAVTLAATLYNPLIQRMHMKSYEEYQKDGGMDLIIPKVNIKTKPVVTEVNLNVSDEELIKIGKLGIANTDGTRRGPLALDLTFMKTIQSHFKKLKRNPTDIELESLAQTWSEHCKHTIFANPMDEVKKGLYKTYIKGATEKVRKLKGKKDFCVSVFTDNSGGIVFDDKYLVTHKVETHNSPSALDPFGGAITGIVGVNRDALGFGLGAKPVANFYGFCFADPRIDVPLYKNQDKIQKMLSSERIMTGVIAGVNAGGNQSGIPTPQGFIYFDERFRGKPLVFVGTVGLIPRKINSKLSHVKKARPGDLIVMIGGRVGKDGIHGATFSSEALSSGSPATAVQIGDPITQKKLSDAIIKEARDLLLYNSITDNGAGGLSCSVSEMAKESGGCVVELEKVPVKYPGLNPWEVWISESQERMTLAIPQKNWPAFAEIMRRHGVQASIIGEFTKSGKCLVNYNKQTIMNLSLDFLHDGLPERPITTQPFNHLPTKPSPKLPEIKNLTNTLINMLKRLNITSFEFISQQYDHIVQGSAVLGPLQGKGRVNSDASVIRPVLTSQKGVILSQGLYPSYSEIDPYGMSAAAIDTAIRNAVAAGANPDHLSLLDNFCWCSSNDPKRLGELKLAAKACYDTALVYQTPYVSGKDSMFNDFHGFDRMGNPVKIPILPTLLISSFGVVSDITKVVSLDAKKPGDLIYLLGGTFDELGGSEYFAMANTYSNTVPKVNAEKNNKLYHAFYQAVQQNLIASSISIGRGGLGVALAKKAIGGMVGLSVRLENIAGSISRDDFALYSESQGRILVTITKEHKKAFENILSGNIFSEIGKVTKEPKIVIKGIQGKEIVNLKLDQATNAYRETFSRY